MVLPALLLLLFHHLIFALVHAGCFPIHGFGHSESFKEQSRWLLDLQGSLIQDQELQVSLHAGESQ